MNELWNDPNRFGAIIGVFGGLLGAYCGVVGAVAGVMAPKARARGFVLGSMYAMLAVAAVFGVLGVVALASGAPFAAWFFPLQIAFILGMINGILIPAIKRRYREAEARRLEAEALRRA